MFREVGCHGVAEAAALAAAGDDAALHIEKQKSKRCTCAIARASGLIQAHSRGLARGRLAVIGLGPGRQDWRTPAAMQEIARAEQLVGYTVHRLCRENEG